MADEWLTIEQASKLSNYHAEHLRELMREGKVKGQKFGIVWQVSKKSLLAHIAAAKKSKDKRRGGKSIETT